MTTTISSPDRFGSLLRGLLKKNIPNMLYLFVLGFLCQPVQYLASMFGHYYDDKMGTVYSYMNTSDPGGIYADLAIGAVPFIWLAGTLVFGIIGVNYMHNRRAVDLYHSLPVTRKQLMLANLTNSFLTVAVPMTANQLITLVLAIVRESFAPGRSDLNIGFALLDLVGWYVTAFAILTVIYMAATQVGSTFDTFIFSGVFLAALPVIYLAHYLMCENFLTGWNYDMLGEVACSLSPALFMFGWYATFPNDGWFIPVLILWMAISAAILWYAMRLYTRRPSERAESHANRGTAVWVFQFLGTFLGGLGLGTIFTYMIGSNGGDVTHLLWIALFGALVYLLVAAVLGRGFKGMGKATLLRGGVMILVTLAYAGIIFTGGLGFESRVPDASKVVSVTVNHRGRFEYVDYFDADNSWEWYSNADHMTHYEYRSINTVTLEGDEAIRAVTAMHEATVSDHPCEGGGSLSIEYKLQNGFTMKRRFYRANCNICGEMATALEATEEFRSCTDPLYYWTSEDSPYEEVIIGGPNGLQSMTLTDKGKIDTLISVLRHDIAAESPNEYYSVDRKTACHIYLPSAVAEAAYDTKMTRDFYASFSVPVSDKYTATLSLLREWGVLDEVTEESWDAGLLAQWGSDVEGSGKIIIPSYYGTQVGFRINDYEHIELTREEVEALLPLSTDTYSERWGDTCFYLLLSRGEPDSQELTVSLPRFIPYEVAFKSGIATEKMEEIMMRYYGYNKEEIYEIFLNENSSSLPVVSYESSASIAPVPYAG